MFDFDEFGRRFTYYFEKYNLGGYVKFAPQFYKFAEELLRENEKYNLTALRSLDDVIVKHFVDSAVILNYMDLHGRVLDIGAGAGFPSVPLAVCRGDLKITCLDSSAKKINFVRGAAQVLGLENLDFHCGRAEDFGQGGYDFAVSRAVARLNILCELAAPALKTGGVFCAYKSKTAREELEESAGAFKILGLELAGFTEFELEGEARVFIAAKKISTTPEKYPRNFSQIIKQPL